MNIEKFGNPMIKSDRLAVGTTDFFPSDRN
jgi:hypothetical protein